MCFHKNNNTMKLDCTCMDISLDEWNHLMRNAKPCNYVRLVKRIKDELPNLYEELMLNIWNPYASMCR